MRSFLIPFFLLAIGTGFSTLGLADEYQQVADAFNRFVSLPISLEQPNPSCQYGQDAPTIQETAVCALTTPSELLAWTLGFDEKCRGERAETVVGEISQELSHVAQERSDILAILQASDPQIRREVCAYYVSTLSSVSDAIKNWYLSEKYLDSLRQYVETQKGISPFERAILYSYFQNGYFAINGVLAMGGQAAKCFEPFSTQLLNILHRLPNFSGTVWRGDSLTDASLQMYRPGAEISWSGFTSTTPDKRVAESFAQAGTGKRKATLFQVVSKNCVDVRGVSDKLHEQEVLCLPGTRVRVTATEAPNVIVLDEI